MNERETLVAVSTFVPFGPARLKLLLSYFKGARKIWRATENELLSVGLNKKTVSQFFLHRSAFTPDKYFNRLKQLKIKTILLGEKNYPANLLEIDDAPMVINVKGDISASDVNAVAIVGSRKMTAYGKEVASTFASQLAAYGITVISGLARGIDTVAHKSACEVGGRTIAVLGCGLDRIYPPENTSLAEEVSQKGAVISEYPLGYPAIRNNFASRNRIISGLAKAVLVIEGAAKSGTLLTASHAAEQGREVFAVPGQITSPLSAAPLFLLKNGAKMATATRDILDELNIQTMVDRQIVEKVMPSGETEAKILKLLENENLHLDELARISSLDIGKLSARLTIMELKGLIVNIGGGIYRKL